MNNEIQETGHETCKLYMGHTRYIHKVKKFDKEEFHILPDPEKIVKHIPLLIVKS